ncbi:hypothetical protein N7528_000714 [Penicillium herquei]|nr:hypothetical protein N7528_000714 [Penicillium herquei]
MQFSKNIDQFPTPSDGKTICTLSIGEVCGVTVDDKKRGSGVAAESGNTVAMHCIGMLKASSVTRARILLHGYCDQGEYLFFPCQRWSW